jgi:methionine synthase II (cobalamin-independent)
MAKINIQDEIRRITNETAANAASKALEVAEAAKAKAAEVSALAISEALKAATLAATKAAEAASAAANIAASTSKDLEYIKTDIAATKADIKEINQKLDNKYTTKEESLTLAKEVERIAKIVDSYSQYPTVKAIVYGLAGLILTAVVGGLMYLVIKSN